MRGEKTTLRAFGGGVDPSVIDIDNEDEVRAREQFVVTGQTSRDLGVRLERDLVERLDPKLLETGEERRQLRMYPQQPDWADSVYIRAKPTDENRKFDQAVMQLNGYPTVGMPRAWLRNRVVRGIDNPFHNAGRDDYVVVRYLSEGAIEIYTEGVYNAHPHFVRIRAVAPFVVVSSDESEMADCYNLAASTPYDGQMVEIVPFDWDVFSTCFHDIIGRDLSEAPEDQPTVNEFTHILTEGGVTPCSIPTLHIQWGEETTLHEIIGSDSSAWEMLSYLTLEDIRRVRLVLPAQVVVIIGSFMDDSYELNMLIHRSLEYRIVESALGDNGFIFSDENGATRINRKYYARINEHWWGRFFEVQDHGPPIIYIPVDPESPFFAEPTYPAS